MCWVACDLIQKGHAPFIPGIDFLMGVVGGYVQESAYRNLSLAFLEVCQAVLVISDSKGVKAELDLARKLNIPIYYSIEDIPNGK